MAKEVRVQVTHFESPASFFFYFEERKFQNKSCLQKIEREVAHVARTALHEPCAKVLGSIIGYLHYKRLGWERAKIVRIDPNGSLKIFLCDRGYFMDIYRDQVTQLIDLPDNLQQPSEIIFEGSLTLQPCDKIQDRETLEVVNQPVRHWNQQAIAHVKKFNQRKENSKLNWKFVPIKTEANIHYGELLLEKTLGTGSLAEELINKNWAVRLDTVQMKPTPQELRPSANIKKIIMNCCPDLLPPKPVCAPQKASKMLPGGVDLGTYSNDRTNKQTGPAARQGEKLRQSRTAPQLASAVSPVDKFAQQTGPVARKEEKLRQPRMTPQLASAVSPLDIFVFGQQAKPAFNSLETTAFSKSIKDYLGTMTKIQSHAWPQIAHGRSIIIVPAMPIPSSLLMTFLPPLINNLVQNSRTEANGLGATTIVIVNNTAEVNDIQRMCTSTAPFLKVQVLGMESKAVQLINGCDLLLATPPAFVRTVEGTTINLFQRDRIKTLVFHGAERLMAKFDSEVNEIVRRCSYGNKNVEKNPQIIVTSSMWTKNIEKLKFLISPSKLVLCVESFIEVAALCKTKITLERSASTEGKFESARKYLEQCGYKTKRTAVVVNDEESLKNLLQKFSESSIQVSPAHVSFELKGESDKRSWLKEESGKYSVLIASDSSFEALKLDQIQNLVHFSVPKTWSIFVQRFSAFMLNFYQRLQQKNEANSTATKIFIDDENNIKEYLHLIKFMQSRQLVGILPELTETVKILLAREEKEKYDQMVAICDKIWMSAECTEFPCMLRHVFGKNDTPSEHCRSKCAIKFEVVNVLNPAHYVIKILSHKIGTNWSSLEETIRQTEALLSNELQEFCTRRENLKKVDIKTTGSYVALIEKTWKRCKAIMNAEPNHPLCKIYLVDEGKEVHCKSANVYELPQQFEEQPPLVYKLRILNLLPLDGESCWTPEANKKAEEMIRNYSRGLTAEIKFAVQDTLFCKSMEAEGSGIAATKINLSKKLTQFCMKDENAGNRLIKLLREAALIQESASSQPDKEIEKLEPPSTTQNSETDEKKNSTKESWKKLSHNSFYDVRVSRFNNPDSFFVVLASQQNKLQVTPDESMNMEKFCDGATCLVKRENMLRGKILRVIDQTVEVFLVDEGEIVACQPSELYTASAETTSKICFRSVHCRLVGVKPKYNMKTWPPKQCDMIEKTIRGIGATLRMYVMNKNEKIDESCMPDQSSYEVILIDPKTGNHLDDVIVSSSFADRDQYEKPKDLENDFNVGSDSGELEKENSDDLLKRMLESMLNEFSETESADERAEETESAEKTIKFQPENNSSESQVLDVAPEPTPIPSALSYLVKHPLVVWQQNEIKVHLSISATDCVDYGMKIADTTVEVAIVYANNRCEKAVIDLYSGIVPEMCSHEKRGLNIVVDLLKKVPNIEWPRLTESKERSQFIRFSNENIKEVSNQPLKGIPAEEMYESDDAEENVWKTEQMELSEEDDAAFY